MSVPADLTTCNKDGVVMQKVASLTLNKAELESKIYKPKFVPEKLDFELYEKFEGESYFDYKTNPHRKRRLLHVILSNQFTSFPRFCMRTLT